MVIEIEPEVDRGPGHAGLDVDTLLATLERAPGDALIRVVADDLAAAAARVPPELRPRTVIVCTQPEPYDAPLTARDVARAGVLAAVSGRGWWEWTSGNVPFTALLPGPGPIPAGFVPVGAGGAVFSRSTPSLPDAIGAYVAARLGASSAGGAGGARAAAALSRLRAIAPDAPEPDERDVAPLVQLFLTRMAEWADRLDRSSEWPWLDLRGALGQADAGRAEIDAWAAEAPEIARGELAARACAEFIGYEAIDPRPELANPWEPLVRVIEAGARLRRSKAGGVEVGMAFVPVGTLARWRAPRG